MSERRRIIIPTVSNPDEPLETPHFDTEATLTARPVIPLSEQETARMSYGDYAPYMKRPLWKRPGFIALIVLLAVGAGVAAGLAIGLYRNRKAATPPVAITAPAAPVENSNANQTVEPTPAPPPERAAVPEKTAELPIEPKDGKRAAQQDQKEDDEATPPPVARDKKPAKDVGNDDDEQIAENRQAERERRREERREQRRRQREDEETIDIPRGIERAGREANRIREIFEGKQP